MNLVGTNGIGDRIAGSIDAVRQAAGWVVKKGFGFYDAVHPAAVGVPACATARRDRQAGDDIVLAVRVWLDNISAATPSNSVTLARAWVPTVGVTPTVDAVKRAALDGDGPDLITLIAKAVRFIVLLKRIRPPNDYYCGTMGYLTHFSVRDGRTLAQRFGVPGGTLLTALKSTTVRVRAVWVAMRPVQLDPLEVAAATG